MRKQAHSRRSKENTHLSRTHQTFEYYKYTPVLLGNGPPTGRRREIPQREREFQARQIQVVVDGSIPRSALCDSHTFDSDERQPMTEADGTREAYDSWPTGGVCVLAGVLWVVRSHCFVHRFVMLAARRRSRFLEAGRECYEFGACVWCVVRPIVVVLRVCDAFSRLRGQRAACAHASTGQKCMFST